MKLLYTILPFLGLTLSSCQQEESDVKLFMDVNTKGKLDLVELTTLQIAELCGTKSLIFFIGNAEETTTTAVNSEEISRNSINLLETVKSDLNSFLQGLSHSGKYCNSTTEFQIKLVAIMDGPSKHDSSIKAFSFGYNDKGKWSEVLNQSFKVVGASIVKSEGELMEIHLPTQINSIISHFSKTDHNNNTVTTEYYNQINYFFKTHGGQADFSGRKPNPVDVISNRTPAALNHIFLFDPNASDDEPRTSELNTPFWKLENACKILKRSGKQAEAGKCRSKLVEKYGASAADKILGSSGSTGTDLGSSGSTGTDLGSSGSSGTDLGSSGSSGTDLGSSGSTGTDLGSSGSSGTDLGSSGSSGTDLGAGSSYSELGSAKSLSYRTRFDTADGADLDKPDYYLNLASSMSWDNKLGIKIDGVTDLTLVGHSSRSSVVFFESCYQRVKDPHSIAEHLFGKKRPKKSVFVGSSAPLNSSVTNYSMLNSEEYVLFAFVYAEPDKYGLENSKKIVLDNPGKTEEVDIFNKTVRIDAGLY